MYVQKHTSVGGQRLTLISNVGLQMRISYNCNFALQVWPRILVGTTNFVTDFGHRFPRKGAVENSQKFAARTFLSTYLCTFLERN
jgi:hypothetical protein